MKAEFWQQVDELFQAAVELDPAARAVFLDKACAGNCSLRSEVDSLLDTDSLEWDFIESPALESAAILFEDEEPRLTSGQQVGHYEIVNLIGRGGMGEVYLARDQILNRNIALKLLPYDYTQDPNRLLRFHQEAQTVSALNHPNILTIHELGSVDGHQFIATELIEGETLRKHITRGPLSVRDALEVAIQTASALAAAHQAGIVHRDIKPENIMLRPDGYVKVLDFGLAKLAELPEPNAPAKAGERLDTSSAFLMGTPRYMSPEQVGGLPVDARSDIFSVGAVLYEMLAGRPPFDDKNPGKLAESILKDDPPALRNYLDAVPNRLNAVVAKMLSKDRESRYQNADDLLLDLKLLRDGVKVKDEGSYRKRPARLRWAAMVLAIVVSAAAVIGYASYSFFRSTGTVPTAASLSESGTWTTKAPISSPRAQAEPSVLNGVLYVAGGWNECTPFADLEAYDLRTDTWTQRAPMLTARGAHGVATLNGKLYAIGGSIDCGDNIANVEAYDPASNTWSARASLQRARANHVVAASNGKLYAIGGITEGGDYLDLNSQYDPETDTWTEKAPMPTARMGAAVAVLDGVIYVIGGQLAPRNLATVEAYDPLTDSWTSKRHMSATRYVLAVSELNGNIYAFGGFGNRTNFEAYDPAADTWTVVAEMPAGRSSVHAAAFDGSIYLIGGFDGINYVSSVIAFTPPANMAPETSQCFTPHSAARAPIPTVRNGPAAGEIGGIIYVIGGHAGHPAGFLTTNEAYDPIIDRWEAKAATPIARETRTSGNTAVGEKLYVIGGNAGGYCSNVNQAYDPKTDTWSTKAPMPTPRCHVAVVAHNGLIYAIGGTNTNGSIRYSTVEVYNPATDAWSHAAPMPTKRQDARAVSISGMIYTLGGLNPVLSQQELDIVEAYDPSTGTWSKKAPMPIGRMGMAVGTLQGMLIVAGGYSNETTLDTVDAYDPVRNTWTSLGSMSTPRSYSSAVTVGDTLYVFGGSDDNESSGSLTTTEALTLSTCLN